MTGPTSTPHDIVDERPVAPTWTEPVRATMRGPDPSAGHPDPRRGLRWIVALVSVAILAVGTFGGAVLLAGARADSTVARWAPADAVAYAEARGDLPGDQRQALGEFLSAFPGFADQTILDQKLDQLYERLVDAATESRQSWSADIAPWFGGQLGVAIGPLPDATSLADEAALAAASRDLAIATTTDPQKAMAWVRATANEAGLTIDTADAGGTELLVFDTQHRHMAAAATDDVLLVGDEASVRAALARGGADGLATDAGFRDAVAGLSDQQLALGYVDTAAVAAWLKTLPSASDRSPSAALSALPSWMSGGLRVESDALVMEGLRPRTAASPDIPDGPSRLPDRLPASTIALAETHDLAAAAAAAMTAGGDASGAQRLDSMLEPIGGIEGLTGWAGEAGAVVVGSGTTALPGVVAIADDPTKAADLVRSLKNLATLAGLSPTTETVDGVSVVSVDLAGLPGMAGATVAKEPLVVSWAASDDLVIAGRGPEFVSEILSASSGRTLADVDAFRQAVDRVGARGQALTWVDLDAVEQLAVATLTPAERTTFDREVRPYLAPLGAFVATTSRDGDLERTRSLLILDQ
jgi:hypothetical protein